MTDPKQPATLTEQETQMRLRAAALVGIGVPALIYFGIMAIVEQEWLLSTLAFITAATCIACFLVLWQRRHGYAAVRPGLACHTALLLYLVVYSGPEHVRALSFLSLPLVCSLLLPPREGGVWAAGSMLLAGYLMTHAGNLDGGSAYSAAYIVRFTILYTLISGVLIWSEILLRSYQTRLQGQSAALAAERDRQEKEIIERAALEEELRYLATTDPLTGLLNRRAFMAMLAGELTRNQRLRSGFTVLMLDIDHFKQINDNHGHPAGDAVLAHLSALLTEQLRGIDKLARMGGDEFAIMLVDTPAEGASTVIERLLDAIRHKPAEHPASHQPIAFTASIGCTESQPEDDELTALARADRALYIAKQAGRDRHAWA